MKTMAIISRLGHVAYWSGLLWAIGLIILKTAITISILSSPYSNFKHLAWQNWGAVFVLAASSWVLGRTARYVMAGKF